MLAPNFGAGSFSCAVSARNLPVLLKTISYVVSSPEELLVKVAAEPSRPNGSLTLSRTRTPSRRPRASNTPAFASAGTPGEARVSPARAMARSTESPAPLFARRAIADSDARRVSGRLPPPRSARGTPTLALRTFTPLGIAFAEPAATSDERKSDVSSWLVLGGFRAESATTTDGLSEIVTLPFARETAAVDAENSVAPWPFWSTDVADERR